MNLDTLINFIVAFPFLTLSQLPWEMLLHDAWMLSRAWFRAWLQGLRRKNAPAPEWPDEGKTF